MSHIRISIIHNWHVTASVKRMKWNCTATMRKISHTVCTFKKWLLPNTNLKKYTVKLCSKQANPLDGDAENVFVERPCEVAFQQLVVEDGLGDDAADKLEVAEMVWVAVWWRVDGVCHTVTGWRTEQSIHRVENLTWYYDVPLAQQTASILTFLSWKISGNTFLKFKN